MKSSRFRYSYRDNASSYHKAVGDCLRGSSLFSGYRIYQEYPVQKINPSYSSAVHRFDWVILDLKLVIEVHGEFHDRPITIGGITEEQAADNLYKQQQRDNAKMDAAIDAGYAYIIIRHSDIRRLNDEYIWQLYQSAAEDTVQKEPTLSYKDTIKQQQREWRKEQYRRHKEARRGGQSNEDNTTGQSSPSSDEEV